MGLRSFAEKIAPTNRTFVGLGWAAVPVEESMMGHSPIRPYDATMATTTCVGCLRTTVHFGVRRYSKPAGWLVGWWSSCEEGKVLKKHCTKLHFLYDKRVLATSLSKLGTWILNGRLRSSRRHVYAKVVNKVIVTKRGVG